MAKSREAETAQAAVTKEQSTGANVKKISQLQQKSQQASEKATGADQEYQDVLRQTNTKQNDFWMTEMPNLLNEFQQFEEERISFTKNILVRYGSMTLELPAVVQNAADNGAAAAEKVDHNSDISGFVQVNKTGATPPPPIDYQSYDGANTPSSPSIINNSASPSSSSASIGSPSTTPANNKFGAYRPSVAVTVNKEWGLTAKDSNLSTEQKLQKLESQIMEIDLLIKSETGQRNGAEKLLQMLASDAAALKKTEAEIAEADKRIVDLNTARKTVQNQMTALAPAAAQDNYQAPAQEEAAYAEPPTLFRVRGLFDYTATCDTELSFKEGDMMNITEQDESGWWYANCDGRVGFVPQNYVEKI
eukprot:TRINITY_DN2647_c0_g1_i2.p1 TRINITY_DN2647_c0_g1~~TRINITY_DN2647_c0_g1_i2.p1  ORF type:complete len:362 (+),score=139.98 TRINITY_DN2647_c0_g1_i2:684-1769(+)